MERDRFFTAAEAADYGLIDAVTSGRKNGNGDARVSSSSA
jgi:ATP-dependent protease ClpP protease subunit